MRVMEEYYRRETDWKFLVIFRSAKFIPQILLILSKIYSSIFRLSLSSNYQQPGHRSPASVRQCARYASVYGLAAIEELGPAGDLSNGFSKGLWGALGNPASRQISNQLPDVAHVRGHNRQVAGQGLLDHIW
jgi:hypothetical protein